MIESAVYWLLNWLSIPEIGFTAVFIVCFVSATLLPLGSEPAVFAVVASNPNTFWDVIAIATIGNTLGGIFNYWIGYCAKQTFAKERDTKWFKWLKRFGTKMMLLSWLPGIGDPLCTLAGWLKLSFWPCTIYMAIGKFVRYITMTWILLNIPADSWRTIAGILG